MYKLGIIRESRSDDRRTPLAPKHLNTIFNSYKDVSVIVQPSEFRCFEDQEYKNNGAIISENLDMCDLILGIKEIEASLLIPNKKYIFFSHTSKIQPDNSAAAQGTPGMDKKELLKEIINKKITLIDYENIRDNQSRRYLGFGRFAGIVGCYNSLNLYLITLGQKPMSRAHEAGTFQRLKENVQNKDFQNARIIVTGDGRVAKGSLEFLEFTNIKKVTTEEYLKNQNTSAIFCNLPTMEYVKRKNSGNFDLQNFINSPHLYFSIINKYMVNASMLISSHYWDPKSPRLFTKKDMINYNKLKVIGDITCDIKGSVPTTLRSSTIEDPYYYLDLDTFKESTKKNNSLAIMAVDNLPSELPKESSLEFGDGIVNAVLPYIIDKDDGRIKNATITNEGKIMPSYSHIKNYIDN